MKGNLINCIRGLRCATEKDFSIPDSQCVSHSKPFNKGFMSLLKFFSYYRSVGCNNLFKEHIKVSTILNFILKERVQKSFQKR